MQLFYAFRAEHAKIFLLAGAWPPSLSLQCHRDADRGETPDAKKSFRTAPKRFFQRLLNTDAWPLTDGPGRELSPVITIAMSALCNLKNPYRSLIVQAVFRAPVCRQRPTARNVFSTCLHRIVVMRRNACKQPCNAFAAGTAYTDDASSPRRGCE